ncbi:MAG: T9SS type A sorting domain-containing protein [bacterium]|nr:T9SS type A sorting domain-containing protein [bacterium]
MITKNQLTGLFFFLNMVTGPLSLLGADLNVPNDYYSIKEALLHAQASDHIKIEPGEYLELNLVVPPGVALSGTGATPDAVVINAEGRGRIMICESLNTTTIIRNITFLNGAATGFAVYDQSGGAILMNNSDLRLVNCNFRNNTAEGHGGAIRCSHASPQIINCNFEGNTALQGGGGAIDCSYESNPVLQSCYFLDNTALWGGALSCRGSSSPIVHGSGFDRNLATGALGYGGGVMADSQANPLFQECSFFGNQGNYGGALASFAGSSTNLDHCTVVGNSSVFIGAGMLCIQSYPSITNTIIAFQDGLSVACSGASLPIIECSNIFGNSGGDWFGSISPQLQVEGNLSVDPQFCDPNLGNNFRFNLVPDSPCAGSADGCGLMGAWSAQCQTTPAYISDFLSQWENGLPKISWTLGNHGPTPELVLRRTTKNHPDGPIQIPIRMTDSGYCEGWDHQLIPQADQQYVYNLFEIQLNDSLKLIDQTTLDGSGMFQPLHLRHAWPNPFNPATTISFEVSGQKEITVEAYDLRGRRVRKLTRQIYMTGVHSLVWDGKNDYGQPLESGTYFIRLQSGTLIENQKVLLLK